jgi:membrane-associated protease RseP (regulator of RpoE activity)
MTFDLMGALFVLISIAVITVLIIVHEFGHFLAARYFGFQTPIFGIGLPFGPAINLFKRWGTQFKFYFLLIGGFVSIPELGDESNQEELKQQLGEDLKPLRHFPVYQRAIVASGGIAFNILFAFLLTIVMIATVGLPQAVPANTIAGFTSETSAARLAGLVAGDKILRIGTTQITNGSELKLAVDSHRDQQLTIVIERPKQGQITKTIKYQESLGVLLGHEKHYQKFANPLSWVTEAFTFTVNTFVSMFISVIILLFTFVNKILAAIFPFISPPVTELGEVKGIVGIVQLISQDIQSNAVMIMEFAILLSLNLAVINLLPIPALDGGHLAFMTYEAIAGSKPSEKFQAIAIQGGLLFILSIMLLTTFNDIKNWIFH